MWKTLFILSFILFVNVIRCDNLNDSQSNQAEPPLEERDRTIEEELNAAADQEDLVAQQLVEDVMLEEKHFDIKLEAEIPDKAPFVEVKQEGPVPPASANNEPPPSNQFAKPRSVLKDIDHTDSTSYKEAPRQNQFAAPLPNQSAYYATPGIPQQREDAGTSGSKKHDAPAEQRASSTPKKPSMLADLASKLNRKISTDQRRRKQEQAEMLQRQQRFRVSRAHAAPVERVLEAYNDPHTDLYDVLGVRRSINDAALRKAYRASALAIHPDKNPHPDAQAAFDALQEAYDAISTPTKRAEYDQETSRRMRIATAKRYSSRRLKKLVHDTLTNWKSSLLLFHHEITHIEGVTPTGSTVSLAQSAGLLWGKVRSAVQAAVTAVMQHVAVQLEHYALLPSAIDRLQLLHEQLWRHKVTLLVVSLVWAGLGRLLQR